MYNNIGNIESVKTYAYTPEGTELSGTPIKTETFTYSADMLTAYNGSSLTYNANGGVSSYDGWDYTWTRGKLSTIRKILSGTSRALISPVLMPSKTYSYSYNGYGQRVGKSYSYIVGAPGMTDVYRGMPIGYDKKFHYDQSGRLIAEDSVNRYYDEMDETDHIVYLYDESGMIGVQYTNGANTNTYYYLRNLQGDVIGIYNTSGTKVVGYTYDAWGNCTIDSSTTDYTLAHDNPIRYRGYYFDSETGFYYLNSRYYNPEWRRFISPDETAYLDSESVNGLNLYCYCNNDPVNYADPSGHLALWIITAIIGAVVGVGVIAAVDYIPDQEFNLHWGCYVGAGVLGAAVGAGIGMAISYTTTGTLSASPKWISAFNKAKAGDYSKLLKLSTKNPNSKYVSLGKYISKNSPENYINIAKRHGFTYFDMGKYYNMADKRGFAQTINKMFLEEQHSLGKIFYKTSLVVSSTYGWELGILDDLGVIPQLFLGG